MTPVSSRTSAFIIGNHQDFELCLKIRVYKMEIKDSPETFPKVHFISRQGASIFYQGKEEGRKNQFLRKKKVIISSVTSVLL